jgi:hypothetical protein
MGIPTPQYSGSVGSFQCPLASFHPECRTVGQNYIALERSYIFRQFPFIDDKVSKDLISANAGMCAADQNKF